MSGSRVIAPGSPPAAVPGEATRRYLRALADRRPEPIDWKAAPPTYKRYRYAGRVVLREPSPHGDLLRGLLGVTRAEWTHRGVRLKRPAPSGGALYPIEAYVALGEPAGLYHYDAAHHTLDLIRPGDHRPLLHASLTRVSAGVPDLVVVLAAVFWRNGFKYREFAYRLQCQEIGVLSAQALALGESQGLDTAVHLRFDDAACQWLLGLDPTRESVLAAVTCASGNAPPPGNPPRLPAAREEHPPPSVVDRLPCLTALHAASATPQPGILPVPPPELHAAPAAPGVLPVPPQATHPVTAAPGVLPVPSQGSHVESAVPGVLPVPSQGSHVESAVPGVLPVPPQESHAESAAPGVLSVPSASSGAVVRLPGAREVRVVDALPLRGSPEAGFLPRHITAETLATVLAHAAAGYPGDLPGCHDAPVTVVPHVLVRRVVGIPAGAYRYDRRTGALVATGGSGDVLEGKLQPNTRLALPESAAVVVPVGDQTTGSTTFGDRWYRLQQAEAGLVVHRAALAATACGLAARIHSDGTNKTTDAVFGLTGPLHALSFLLLGIPRPGITVTGPLG